MNTSFEEIYEIFFDKIAKDEDFFSYEELLDSEAMEIAYQRAEALLKSAIARLMNYCVPEVDFYDFDINTKQFNFQCTEIEKDLISELMKEELLNQDEMRLKVVHGYFNTKDLKTFSPAKERETFVGMLKTIHDRNNTKIENYIAKDRKTGKYKTLNFNYEK